MFTIAGQKGGTHAWISYLNILSGRRMLVTSADGCPMPECLLQKVIVPECRLQLVVGILHLNV